jgi:hypothetical protein
MRMWEHKVRRPRGREHALGAHAPAQARPGLVFKSSRTRPAETWCFKL